VIRTAAIECIHATQCSAADRTLILNINCFINFSVTYDFVFSVTVFEVK